jgi:ssDNA-binding replication factor A large subunit
MVDENYQRILEKIAKKSGVEKEELEKRVEAKRVKLAGLISHEGAAQVIAAELGINFDEDKLKIDELLSGMRKVNVVGKILNLFPVRTFTTKNGDLGKVANFFIADETSNIKVVLWDVNHIDLIENGQISEGKVVEIVNASMRDNEIHLGSFSEFKLSDEVLKDVKTEKIVKEKKLIDFRVGESSCVRAFIVQSFEPRFFYVCPECRKKVVSGAEGFVCAEHGKITEEKRALISIVLDDGTETMKSVLFHEQLPKIGITELENIEMLLNQRDDLLGKEMIFSGNVRTNKMFNNIEFIINDANELDLDKLIADLEQ